MTIEVFPAYEERGVRISLFGDEVERIASVDPLTGEIVEELERLVLFPASHYVIQLCALAIRSRVPAGLVATQLGVHPSHTERLIRAFAPEPSAARPAEGAGVVESRP